MGIIAQSKGTAEPAGSILDRLKGVDGHGSGLDADTLDGKHASELEPAFDKNTAFNKNFGSTAGTVTEGNDPRLTDARAPVEHTHDDYDIISLSAEKLTGTIPIGRLPAGALERLIIVANEAERFALTSAQVQTGDTVKQDDTKVMYRVVDDARLDSELGYVEYSAARAAAVDWSGVENKPSTYPPSSHATAHVTGADKIPNVVAGGNSGLMTGADKTKLDGVEENANNYVHPANHDDRYYTEAEVDVAIATREPAFSKNTAFNKDFGDSAGTVTEGNDPRLSDPRVPTAHDNAAHSDIDQPLKMTSSPTFDSLELTKSVKVGAEAYFDSQIDNGNSGTAKTINWTLGNKQRVTMTGNCTFAFTPPSGPSNLLLLLQQDATGNRTATWPSTVKWAGGVTPSISAAADRIALVGLYWDGQRYLASLSPNFPA